jgi:hypothetical protein
MPQQHIQARGEIAIEKKEKRIGFSEAEATARCSNGHGTLPRQMSAPSCDGLSKPTSRYDESACVLTFRRILQILG